VCNKFQVLSVNVKYSVIQIVYIVMQIMLLLLVMVVVVAVAVENVKYGVLQRVLLWKPV